MAKKIEIFENTLLKLLIRRGIDADRRNVVLSESELGYTLDTKRLFVGDGQTKGGVIAGNLFTGSVSNVTILTDSLFGDSAYDNNNRKLYTLTGPDPSLISDWTYVAGNYVPKDTTIIISDTNEVSVGKLSAGNLSTDILGDSLTFDVNGRFTLSSTIAVDRIIGKSTPVLNIPGTLNIGNVNYTWPVGGVSNETFLRTDITGKLSWSNPLLGSTLFVAGKAGQIPVGSIMPFISAGGAPYGWLLCNGQSVLGTDYPDLSAVIGTSFGGDSTTFKLPDLTNKAIYGVIDDPASSITYPIVTGDVLALESYSETLSAAGALYIIKARKDEIVDSIMSVTPGLTASVNDVNKSSFSPLTGDIELGLDYNAIASRLRGASIVPSAAVGFSQAGTIANNVNVLSVALSSTAYLTGVTGQVYNGSTPGASYKDGGNSGVYVIDLDGEVIDPANTIVQIQANNFRQSNPGGEKVMDNSIPLYDYGWVSPSRLVIGILTTVYSNSDRRSSGDRIYVYGDSGVVNANTKFSVIVYG